MARILAYDSIVSLPKEPAAAELGFELAREQLVALHGEGYIVGGMLYGSRVMSDALPTSDIDQITVVEDRTFETLRRIRNATSTVLASSGLFVENVTYTRNELQRGDHRLHPGLVSDLKKQASVYRSNVVGSGVLQFILPWERDNVKDICGYIDSQLFLLQNYYTWAGHESPHELLETMLHIPLRACRKSLGILQGLGVIKPEVMPDVRKQTVAQAVQDVYGNRDQRLGELFLQVSQYIESYPAIIDDVVSGTLNRDEYDQLIVATVQSVGPVSFELLQRVRASFLDLAAK